MSPACQAPPAAAPPPPGGRTGSDASCPDADLGAKRCGSIMPRDAILEMSDPLQSCVPAGFELARDQTLGRIDEFVASGGQGGPRTVPPRGTQGSDKNLAVQLRTLAIEN
jgi:hypothetical protein